ncbi:MAG: hypothetical protein R3B45_04905 [Bdellovibrionota bacterium]
MIRFAIAIFVMLTLQCKEIPSDQVSSGKGGVNDGDSGGDLVNGNPWFVENRSYTYCVQYGDESIFSRDLVSAVKLINDALNDWINTIKLLKNDGGSSDLGGLNHLELATDFKLKNECDENTDLIFTLGIKTPAISTYIDLLSKKDPVVFSMPRSMALPRTLISQDKPSMKGDIWLSPDRPTQSGDKQDFWSDDMVFFNTILHELGHVFGFGHDTSVLMAENLVEFLVKRGKGLWNRRSKLSSKFYLGDRPFAMSEDKKCWHAFFAFDPTIGGASGFQSYPQLYNAFGIAPPQDNHKWQICTTYTGNHSWSGNVSHPFKAKLPLDHFRLEIKSEDAKSLKIAEFVGRTEKVMRRILGRYPGTFQDTFKGGTFERIFQVVFGEFLLNQSAIGLISYDGQEFPAIMREGPLQTTQSLMVFYRNNWEEIQLSPSSFRDYQDVIGAWMEREEVGL